ncbi:hypothetical protein CYMTET_9190 [Cymbomonas tetramitiformis]|uniref:Uncharacterized protein n=1 Tax=Cymbomonas tetramitiformis TaxID=36881 RepID=A0AAE0LFR0_9CHLO|nr:hypothetical protein CYMTET_9190 [Cymbomonas tetramitiformis]
MSGETNEFPPLLGCLSQEGCLPNCFPKAVCSPCITLGATETLIVGEEFHSSCLCNKALGLGSEGLKTCLCFCPCGMWGTPSGGGPSPASLLMIPIHIKGISQRRKVCEKYNIPEATGFSLAKQIFCYSCAMFQVYAFLKKKKAESAQANSVSENPSNSTEITTSPPTPQQV